MKPVTFTICLAGSPSGRILRNCSSTGALVSRGITSVETDVAVPCGGSGTPRPQLIREHRKRKRHRTTRDLQMYPDNEALSTVVQLSREVAWKIHHSTP